MINSFLIIRPNPNPFESWRGYILRLTEENYVETPKAILRLSDISEKEIRTSIPKIKHIANISNKSEEILQAIYPVQINSSKINYLNHVIPKQYLRMTSPHICTECVKDIGFLHARWDFVHMYVCHIHKKKLISHCPSCASKLSWFRPKVLSCKCGYDFSNDVGDFVSADEVAFAECLSITIEKNSNTYESKSTSIPLPFYQMSPHTLIGLFNSFGNRSLTIKNEQLKLSTVDDHRVYLEGIKILNNWEQEFRKLMLNSIHDGEKEQSSIRKRFENFHGSLFKKKYPVNEIKFLEETYKKVSLELTDAPILDRRLISRFSINDGEISYQGVARAAKFAGVMPSTMRNMVKSGKVKVKQIINSSGNEVDVIDVKSINIKLHSKLGELGQREAAAYVGLPVKVMESLRKSGHIKSDYRTIYSSGWAIEDLDVFINKIYLCGADYDLRDCSDPVELKYILQKLNVNSVDIKADILRALLDRQIKLVSKDKSFSNMFLSKQQLYSFIDEKRISHSGLMTLQDLKTKLGLDPSCAEFIIETKIFRSELIGRYYKYNKSDVEKFHSEYIALAKVSADFQVGIRTLLNKIEEKNVTKINFIRKSGIPQTFVKRKNICEILI